MDKKIILFELNEVPFRILDYFIRVSPNSSIARLLPKLRQYESYSEDESSLSPWKTWPTLHRGVIDEKHLLHNFGQDLREVDNHYPPVWKILAKNGIRSGVFASLHTYPMPESLDNFAFYFPDTFAAGSECFPETLSTFQSFNLEMARESSRNVSGRIPWRSAMQLLAKSPSLGLKLSTYAELATHVASEKISRWKKVRRRTYQVVLAFDIFMKQLEKTKPDFTTFFTNHVASSMHRYWAACFPDDYDEFEFTDKWVNTYLNEIHFTMTKFDEMFERLVKFVDRSPDHVLWVSTSMGQEATVAEPLETQLYVSDHAKFMEQLGLKTEDWETRPSMLPRYNYFVKPDKSSAFLESVKTLFVDGNQVEVAEADGNFFMIKLGHENLHEKPQYVRLDGKDISFEEMGLENTIIDDKSNTTAYHVPTGMLLIYDPRDRERRGDSGTRAQVSTLDIAPAILSNYSIGVPEYMKKPTAAI